MKILPGKSSHLIRGCRIDLFSGSTKLETQQLMSVPPSAIEISPSRRASSTDRSCRHEAEGTSGSQVQVSSV